MDYPALGSSSLDILEMVEALSKRIWRLGMLGRLLLIVVVVMILLLVADRFFGSGHVAAEAQQIVSRVFDIVQQLWRQVQQRL